MIEQAFNDILQDQCSPEVVRAIEAGADPAPLWNAVADAGFLDLLKPEADGGAALPLDELLGVLMLLGRYCVPLPVAQSIAARALLPAASLGTGRLSLTPSLQRTADGGWCAPQVPYGDICDEVLGDDGEQLWLLPVAGARCAPNAIRGSQLVRLDWPAGAPVQRFERQGTELRHWGAALNAALMAGAMTRVLEMSLEHGNTRSQFGKSIGKFQAVQHQLSVLAEQVALSRMAAQCAFRGPVLQPLAAAMAKACCSEAVVEVTAIAHAVHGAIGVTEAYDLQLLTRRLHEWRMLHGSEAYWHAQVGEAVLSDGENSLADFARLAL